jgi:hypothetical protein
VSDTTQFLAISKENIEPATVAISQLGEMHQQIRLWYLQYLVNFQILNPLSMPK